MKITITSKVTGERRELIRGLTMESAQDFAQSANWKWSVTSDDWDPKTGKWEWFMTIEEE